MTFNSQNGPPDAPGQTETAVISLPPTYSIQKPDTIRLNKVYVHVGNEKIYFGRGGELKKGGLIRVRIKASGPQRDPLERLAWAQEQATNFKQWLFNEASHVVEDENGEFDDTDGGGRALIAHILGHPTIEAFVSRNVSLEQRAKMFREHGHSRVALGAVQDFIARVAECDARCVAIKNAIHPNYLVKKNGKDAINSVAALFTIYDHAGPSVLRRAAQLAGTAWKPKFDKGKGGKLKRQKDKPGYHVEGIVLVALALVVEALPEKYDEAKLRKYLAEHSPAEIKAKANEDIQKLAELSSKKSSAIAYKLLSQHMAKPIAHVIARAYNNRLDDDFIGIDLGDINGSLLAAAFSKVRSGRE